VPILKGIRNFSHSRHDRSPILGLSCESTPIKAHSSCCSPSITSELADSYPVDIYLLQQFCHCTGVSQVRLCSPPRPSGPPVKGWLCHHSSQMIHSALQASIQGSTCCFLEEKPKALVITLCTCTCISILYITPWSCHLESTSIPSWLVNYIIGSNLLSMPIQCACLSTNVPTCGLFHSYQLHVPTQHVCMQHPLKLTTGTYVFAHTRVRLPSWHSREAWISSSWPWQ